MRCSFSLSNLSLGLIGLAVSWTSTAHAERRWVETVDLLPTASVVEVSRTYLVPSSYVWPTSVVSNSAVIYPTTMTAASVYVPTTYYAPTTYLVPRSYRSYRAYRPRRYVETTYVSSYPTTLTPTYYVSPTTWLSSTSYVTGTGFVSTSAGLCCEMATGAIVPVAPSNGSNSETAAPKPLRKSADADERRPAATLDSTVAEEPGYPSETAKPDRDGSLNTTQGTAEPIPPLPRKAVPATGSDAVRESSKPSDYPDPIVPAKKAPVTSAVPAKPKDAAVVKEEQPVPPVPVLPAAKPETPPATTKDAVKKPATETPIPIAPPTPPVPTDLESISPLNNEPPPIDSIPALPPPKTEDATKRNALKPVYPSNNLIRPKRNVLEGKIISADLLNPEENVEIVITDRSARYVDRTTRTNAFGEFAITLPEGDWTIKVTMPSGRTLAVGQGQVTASAGKIIDMYGRDLKNLVIKR